MSDSHVWVQAGQPVGAIHIAAAADEPERFAAQQLQHYLKRISGADVPIVDHLGDRKTPAICLIHAGRPSQSKHLGDCPVDQLTDDGYAIHSVGDDVVITSRDSFGLVHGTYQYLARVLDCSFLDMGPEGEDIPRTRTIQHDPVRILKNPKLPYRGMQMAYGSRRVDWMAKNGFNWVRMGNDNDLEWWDEKLKLLAPEYKKRGMRITFGHHSFHMILPTERYAQDNPEYFQKVDGKPVKQGQFYWSMKDREVLDEVVWRIDWFLKRHPEIEQFDFWPADGIAEVDEDDYREWTGEDMPTDWPDKDRLASSSLTGRMGDPRKARLYALMTRQLAEALGPKHPNVRFIITAYADLTQPCPQTPLPANVSCTIAMYWRCYKHSLFDEGCVYNDQYRQIVREWTQMYPDRATYLSEYYMGMGVHIALPYPIVTVIFREWEQLREMGVAGGKVNTGREVDRCGVPYNINYLAFQAVVWGDCDDPDAFLELYCRRFFDDASQPLLEMYRLWEKRIQDSEHTQPGYHRFYAMFDLETTDRSRQLLLQALEQTRNPKVIYRVSRLLMLVNYTAKALAPGDKPFEHSQRQFAGEDVSDMERELLPWLEDMVAEFARLRDLDVDVVNFVGDTEHMTPAEQREKGSRWESDLARMQKADWVKDEFNPDILERKPADKGKA